MFGQQDSMPSASFTISAKGTRTTNEPLCMTSDETWTSSLTEPCLVAPRHSPESPAPFSEPSYTWNSTFPRMHDMELPAQAQATAPRQPLLKLVLPLL